MERSSSRTRGRVVVVLLIVSSATLPIGMMLNLFTMCPSLGEETIDALAWYFFDYDLSPQSYSLISGIWQLVRTGDIILAGLFFICCVFFPLGKQAVLWRLTSPAIPHRAKRRAVRVLEILAPLSLLEILALSVTLLAFKHFPGGTRIVIREGAFVFLASIVANLVAVRLLRPRKRQLAPSDAAIAAASRSHRRSGGERVEDGVLSQCAPSR